MPEESVQVQPKEIKSGLITKQYDPSTVGIFLTSHPRQQMFWEKGLRSWDNCPYHVILCYDDVNDEKIRDHVKDYNIKEIVCTGQRSGHVKGELLQMQMGTKYFSDKNFIYTMKLAADYEIDASSIYRLWEILEEPRFVVDEGTIGAQILHIGTVLIYGYTHLFYSLMKPFDYHHKCGAAEIYFNRMRRNLNLIRAGYAGGKAGLEKELSLHHVQGQYAYDNKTSVQATWDIGEIWK